MAMKPGLAAVFMMTMLAGCVPDTSAENACGAKDLQGLTGQSVRVLETMRFGTELRLIRPGTAVTMDFRPDRLNIETDADERITRVYCG